MDEIANPNVSAIAEAVDKAGERVAVAGICKAYHRSRAAKGDLMMFLTLDDLTGNMEVIVLPAVYRQTRLILDITIPTVIVGVMEMVPVRTDPFLRAEKIMRIE